MVLVILARAITQEKEIKFTQIRKEKVKLSFFFNDMILYIENRKHSTRTLVELINQLNKVAVHKINIKKSVCFYTLTMKHLKRNKEKNAIHNRIKNNYRNKFKHGGKRPVH